MAETSKIALVTGGSRGLGKDMAISLAEKGFDVIITFKNNEDAAKDTIKDINQLGRKGAALLLDMTNFDSIDSFVEKTVGTLQSVWNAKKFDFLINNAGMGATVPFEKVTEKIFDDFLNVHFKGVYFLTQKLVAYMNDGGRIINISTGTTRFSNPGYSVYASMKGAVEVLTKYLAKELGPRGITVNVVAPGPIETDFNNAFIRSNPQVRERLSGLSPLARVGVAEDVGPVVAFLCTNDAGWINGQRIEVSGGINI